MDTTMNATMHTTIENDISVKDESIESEEEDKLVISEPPPMKQEVQEDEYMDDEDIPLVSLYFVFNV